MSLGLYDRGYLVFYKEEDSALYREFLVFKGSVNDKFHAIKEGETLHSIARKYYGTSYSWYLIADANVETIEDIFALPVGEVVLIPNVLVT